MTYPNTIATDVIRRLGLSDVYSLTPGGTITVSVDKRGGLYAGAVLYTFDTLITKNSAWIGVGGATANDVVDAAIPAAATAVAFNCSAITDTATPRVGALFTVKDANTANSLTRHHRMRSNSGDGAQAVFTPLFLPPGDPLTFLDFTALGNMFTDVARTTEVASDGDDINAIVDSGSWGGVYDTTIGNSNAPRYTTGVLNGFSGCQFDSANSESLISTLNNSPDFEKTMSWLVIGFVHSAPGVTGLMWAPAVNNLGRVQASNTQIRVDGPGNKATQVWTHDGSGGFAAWMESPNGASQEVSISEVAGTDGPFSKAQSNPASTDETAVGSATVGTNSFADNVSVLQAIGWSGAGAVTQAQMEQYATDKFGITWA